MSDAPIKSAESDFSMCWLPQNGYNMAIRIKMPFLTTMNEDGSMSDESAIMEFKDSDDEQCQSLEFAAKLREEWFEDGWERVAPEDRTLDTSKNAKA